MKPESIVDFGEMPVYMGCVSTPEVNDVNWSMEWGINPNGLLTVLNPPPLALVYPEQHSDPTNSSLWMRHHHSLASFIASIAESQDVLEIGAAHGILSEIVSSEHPGRFNWVIVEPNPTNVDRTSVRIIRGWFPEALVDERASWPVIVSSHVLEHALDPIKFVRDCNLSQPVGGQLILSWPDMQKMAERTDLNMLNFEHLHYLPSTIVIKILELSGYEVEEFREFEGHSVFLSAKKTNESLSLLTEESLTTNASELAELSVRYKRTLESTVKKFNDAMRDWEGDIWLFGAHIFTQYLIAGGLELSRAVGILDNAKSKHGLRLYGTNLLVHSPSELSGKSDQLILLAAALYEEEIIAQLKTIELSESVVFSSLAGRVTLS